jgi:hypothetical protein
MSQLQNDTRRLHGKGDPQVVRVSQLAEVLNAWMKRYLAERPVNMQGGERYDFMGPFKWLANESGVHPRRISGITNGEFEYIGEQQAFKLLLAVDREYMLMTGEIEILDNPNWSQERLYEWRREQGCA